MDVHTAMPLPQWGFAPIVKKFSEKYHWEVSHNVCLAISEFGERNELFERNVKDNGLAQRTYPKLGGKNVFLTFCSKSKNRARHSNFRQCLQMG